MTFAQMVVERGREETEREKGRVKRQGDKRELGMVGHGQGAVKDTVEIIERPAEVNKPSPRSQESNNSQARGSLQCGEDSFYPLVEGHLS